MLDGPKNFNTLAVPAAENGTLMEVEYVDFTNPESIAVFKDDVFEQVKNITELSNQYFKRQSKDYTLQEYDKIGLQNTALVRAFYSRFQAQCAQLEAGLLAGDVEVSTVISQLNRSYEVIQDKIAVVISTLKTVPENLIIGDEVVLHTTEVMSQPQARSQFQSILRQADVPEDKITKLTKKSIDAVFDNKDISANPERLAQEIERILSNARTEAAQSSKSETAEPSVVVETQLPKESFEQPEVLTQTEIDTRLDRLTEMLTNSKIGSHAEMSQLDRDTGMELKARLFALKRRTQHFQEPYSIDNDPVNRRNVLSKTALALQSTVKEIDSWVQAIVRKQPVVTAIESKIDLAPEALASEMVIDTPEDLPATPLASLDLTPDMKISTKEPLTDLLIRAKELTAQIAGHTDEGTVNSLWENYHRISTIDGKTDSMRQLLESIITMTEEAGLSESAFEKLLEQTILTVEHHETAKVMYQKYVQHKEKQVHPEVLKQDVADIKNFLSLEAIGVLDVLNRVAELEVAINEKKWPATPDEDVAQNFVALIQNVRTNANAEQVDSKKVRATFNVLQEYYLDQLQQQSREKVVQESTLLRYEQSKTEYLTAIERLASIRQAIADGKMPQRAIDEFLDPAIDGLERAQREYQNFLNQVNAFTTVDTSDVVTAESSKIKSSFFERAFRPKVEPGKVSLATHIDVPGVVLNDPVVSAVRLEGESVYSVKATEVTPDNTVNLPTVDRVNEYTVERATESGEIVFSTERLQQFKSEYKPNRQAYAEDFQSWVDGVQGVHPKRLIRIFNNSEHHDAYDTLKNMTITQVRDVIRSPLVNLPQLKILPEDFEHWRRFMTTIFMVPGLRGAVPNDTKFGELAELGFMYDTLVKNKKNSL